jgi:hypothetical protein
VPRSHQPSLDEFINQRTAIGVAGRRLARLDPHARAACLQSVRSRLEALSPEDFIDRSQVITAAAVDRGPAQRVAAACARHAMCTTAALATVPVLLYR